LEKEEELHKRKIKQLYDSQASTLFRWPIEIEYLNMQISSKFQKIQQCAYFLDELDDFDKLSIMFVYDSAENFQLPEILASIEHQMRNPNRLDFIGTNHFLRQDFTFTEYLEHLKLSSVSSRMTQFLAFHHNNLPYVVDRLIKVFNALQTDETSLNSR
jgi:hypothetical protein